MGIIKIQCFFFLCVSVLPGLFTFIYYSIILLSLFSLHWVLDAVSAGVKRQRRETDHHLHLVPRLRDISPNHLLLHSVMLNKISPEKTVCLWPHDRRLPPSCCPLETPDSDAPCLDRAPPTAQETNPIRIHHIRHHTSTTCQLLISSRQDNDLQDIPSNE
jgi:hypothetical protein